MIKEKIINILQQTKEEDLSYITFTDQTNIIDEVGLDSLELINFVLQLEDTFEIEIDFEEFDYSLFLKFMDLQYYVEQRCNLK